MRTTPKGGLAASGEVKEAWGRFSGLKAQSVLDFFQCQLAGIFSALLLS